MGGRCMRCLGASCGSFFHTVAYGFEASTTAFGAGREGPVRAGGARASGREGRVMAVSRTPRGRWVEEGLRALGDGGLDAVRIEPLAQAIGVTKGGVYWHFADRG